MLLALEVIEVILTGLLLGVFLVAYTHFRSASYKLEFLLVAVATVTLIAISKIIMMLLTLAVKVVF